MERDALLLCFTIFSAIVVHSSSATNVNYTDCGSKEAEIKSLDLTPCDEVPCNFKIGTTVSGTLSFIAKEYFTSGRVKAYAMIDGITIPLPIPDSACDGPYSLQCPINKEQAVKFVIKQTIQQGFPITKLQVKGELTDPQGNMVFCFITPLLQISPAKHLVV